MMIQIGFGKFSKDKIMMMIRNQLSHYTHEIVSLDGIIFT